MISYISLYVWCRRLIVFGCVCLCVCSLTEFICSAMIPSNSISLQAPVWPEACPPFIFFIPLILFSLYSPLWADPAVHSASPCCNSPCLLCSCLSLCSRPTPHPLPFFSCQSALWCVDRWCPWPRYESLSSSPPRALLTHNSSTLPNPSPPLSRLFCQPSVFSVSKSFAHWWTSLLFFCQIPLFWHFVVIKFY